VLLELVLGVVVDLCVTYKLVLDELLQFLIDIDSMMMLILIQQKIIMLKQ